VEPIQLVLSRFGLSLAGLRWERVGGGFSGAEVWRGDNANGPCYALKAWPVGFPVARLEAIHRWMGRAGHFPYIPRLLRALDGRTLVDTADQLWDAAQWMPGFAREEPTIGEIETACATIAELHAAWRDESTRTPAPGVRNRLQLMRGWLSAPRPAAWAAPSFSRTLLDRAARVVARAVPAALAALSPWEHVSLRCQPCLRDLRAEHVLFVGGRATGVIDFGAMAIDHPAVDLARLLGDFADQAADIFAIGWRAYCDVGGELETSPEFLAQLARTGSLGSAINWLMRLQNPDVLPVGVAALEARLERILGRIERFAPA